MNQGNEKETITVLLVFTANGETLTPMVVFRTQDHQKNPDWFLGRSETGRMRSEIFYEYVVNGVNTLEMNTEVTSNIHGNSSGQAQESALDILFKKPRNSYTDPKNQYTSFLSEPEVDHHRSVRMVASPGKEISCSCEARKRISTMKSG